MRIKPTLSTNLPASDSHRLSLRLLISLLLILAWLSAAAGGPLAAAPAPAQAAVGLAPADWTAAQAIVPGSYLKASNSEASDLFGDSLAISGDTIVIGASFEDSAATGINGSQSDNSADTAGAAYVLVRSGSSWSQQAYLKASNMEAGDEFATSVAIDGDTIVVGAYREDSSAVGVNGSQSDNSAPNAGAVYVFTRSGTVWSQQAYLKASNTGAGDGFGWAVAISGNTIVVSTDGEDSGAAGVNGAQGDNSAPGSGAAYVFTRSGTVWSQQAYLKASNPEASDGFGFAAAISGDSILIGANREDSAAVGVNGSQGDNSASQAGAAYLFTRSGTVWSQQAYLKASNSGASDRFGVAVALDGDTAVVGATGESSSAAGVNGDQGDDSFSGAGAAYVFVRSGSSWSQQAYLKASNPDSSDNFGVSLAILGDSLVVGASSEDSAAVDINGDQSDNTAADAGAAYLFARGGTQWGQDAYLKASNSDASDGFGGRNSVGIAADYLVAGAAGEASSATGVDGSEANNDLPGAGAAYTFDMGLPVIRWANPAGGGWATAANWLPATVPGSSAETVFDLNNSYDVNVGARQSGRSRVEAGSVLFQSADLTLTGPFSVGGGASFSLPEGTLSAGDLIVGHLPPANPANPPTAHVTISNDGTVFTAGAQTIVGQAGAGDLFVNDGRLNSGEALIGQGSPGTATVGGVNALWQVTSLDVGAGFTATLNIEGSGRVLVDSAAVIGQAGSLQPYPALVQVDNAGVPLAYLANFGANDLTIGDALPGTLDIRNGGAAAVFGLLQAGLQAHNLLLPDALIVVDGSDGAGTQASAFAAFGDALLGMGDGTQAEWLITNGGSGGVLGNLHLGHTAGSRAALTVSGFSADGLRSTMAAGTASELCRVGFDGDGSVRVSDGGLLTCRNMNIGGNVGSSGEVVVTGRRGSVNASLEVNGALCVGGAPLCGSGMDVAGTLALQDHGFVKADILVVTPGGHLLGQGTAQAGQTILAGEVSPGVTLVTGSAAFMAGGQAGIQPAALVISSSVELTDTAVIALDILAADSYDQLLITGTAKIAGTLALTFRGGYAPKQGDAFTFIQAGSSSGSFAAVLINGLKAGFQYDVAVTNGMVTLTALNDGAPASFPVYLPVILR